MAITDAHMTKMRAAKQQCPEIAVEDAADDSTLTPEQLKRKQNRERKRKQRAEEKQQRDAEKEAADLSKYETPQEFWAAQQATLPPKELEKMLARHDDLLLLVDCMRDYVQHTLEETGTTQQDLDETIQEAREWMQKGEVLVEITLVSKFWLDKEFFQSVVERGGPTATFARYGLLDALPAHSIHDFQQKFMKPAYVTPADMQEWKTLICSQCPSERKLESSRCVPKEVAEAYVSKKIHFICHRCRAGEQQAPQTFRSNDLGHEPSGRSKPVVRFIPKTERPIGAGAGTPYPAS
jgi:hypothetical protein